jgi:hypothetical protein
MIATSAYFDKLAECIVKLHETPVRTDPTYDVLDTEKQEINKKIALFDRQRTMRQGHIWQHAIGTYQDNEDLGVGDPTGLDVINHVKKYIVEVKSRTNTDNASSRKTNFDKLAKFKRENPDYRCIYATINADTELKSSRATVKKIKHDGIEIEHHTGREFLRFVFGDDADAVIEFIKTKIDECTPDPVQLGAHDEMQKAITLLKGCGYTVTSP